MATRRWPVDRVADALWVGAFAFAALAVAARAWPATPRVAELPPTSVAPPTSASLGGPPPATGALQSDVFSPGHALPRTRWTPPAVDTLPPGLAPDPAMAASLGTSSSAADDAPRFYGTIIDARGAAALLSVGGASSVARLYREGERAAGWRVLRVAADRVSLVTPGGERITLRLPHGNDAPPDTTSPER